MDYCSQLCIQFDFYYIGYFESFYTCKVYIEATREYILVTSKYNNIHHSDIYPPTPGKKKGAASKNVYFKNIYFKNIDFKELFSTWERGYIVYIILQYYINPHRRSTDRFHSCYYMRGGVYYRAYMHNFFISPPRSKMRSYVHILSRII